MPWIPTVALSGSSLRLELNGLAVAIISLSHAAGGCNRGYHILQTFQISRNIDNSGCQASNLQEVTNQILMKRLDKDYCLRVFDLTKFEFFFCLGCDGEIMRMKKPIDPSKNVRILSLFTNP